MNDFFTDLDSDLREHTVISHRPERHAIKAERYAPVSRNPQPIPAVPVHKKPAPARTDTRNGHWIAPAPGHMGEVRSQIVQSWVVVLVFRADEKTQALLGHVKLETRGFAHLNEVREVHKAIIKRARASYEDTVKDIPDIEERDLIKIIRQDMELFLTQRFERNPVVIPIIMYV